MDIKDLIGTKGVSITIGIDDLHTFMAEIAERTKPETQPKYLTPKQVCEMLAIDNSTLWRWGQNRYLPSIKVGGKSRYRLSDIQKLLENEPA